MNDPAAVQVVDRPTQLAHHVLRLGLADAPACLQDVREIRATAELQHQKYRGGLDEEVRDSHDDPSRCRGRTVHVQLALRDGGPWDLLDGHHLARRLGARAVDGAKAALADTAHQIVSTPAAAGRASAVAQRVTRLALHVAPPAVDRPSVLLRGGDGHVGRRRRRRSAGTTANHV
eukprot:scaffold9750_cov116-Isochrysis_galbana.AAC.3